MIDPKILLGDIVNRLNAAFTEIACIEVKGAYAPNVTRAQTHLREAAKAARELIEREPAPQPNDACQP